jgi:NTE family protein
MSDYQDSQQSVATPTDQAAEMAAETAPATMNADLVLEGGGVKGIGLVGAVQLLAESGYQAQRLAGTSAGAITAAIVAAMRQYGEPLDRLDDIVLSLDYRRFQDRGWLARRSGPLRPLFDVLNLVFDNGIYEGDYLRDWLTSTLADLRVETFGDLRLPDDDATGLPGTHRYRVAMIVSDVSRRRAARLPWDYPEYGLDPDEQSVALAARMSASIPFYFEPVTMRTPDGASTMVDGAVFSNFPVTIFDRTDGKPPRWPTFGVKLSGRVEERPHTQAVEGPVSLTLALVESMLGAWDVMHLSEPCTVNRTIFVDTSGVSPIDFDITDDQQRGLLAAGRSGAEAFLSTWNFDDYKRYSRGGPQ